MSHMTWPACQDDILNWVRSCPCNHFTSGRGRSLKPAMQTTVKGTRPFQICLVDYIDLPKTRCGFQYGLTILCTFTKWLICVPSRLHRAVDTVNAIQRHLLDRFPQPEVIRSDRGRHFINTMCREFSQIKGFDWRFHVSYHPQSCGALEVQHRVLKNALFILCHELRCEWIEVLPAVLQKLNALPNSSTGISPFEAVWGRRPELTNFDAVSNGVTSTDVPTFVRKQSDAMKIIHDKIKLCQERHDSASIRRNKPLLPSCLQTWPIRSKKTSKLKLRLRPKKTKGPLRAKRPLPKKKRLTWTLEKTTKLPHMSAASKFPRENHVGCEIWLPKAS
ncbi:unnamed protein product, partial [Oikopleura dioica]